MRLFVKCAACGEIYGRFNADTVPDVVGYVETVVDHRRGCNPWQSWAQQIMDKHVIPNDASALVGGL